MANRKYRQPLAVADFVGDISHALDSGVPQAISTIANLGIIDVDAIPRPRGCDGGGDGTEAFFACFCGRLVSYFRRVWLQGRTKRPFDTTYGQDTYTA